MKKPVKRRGALSALLMAALLMLGSCNFAGDEPAPTEEPNMVAAATPYPGPSAGEYFNAAAAASLRLDGAGGFVLSSAGGRAEGSYTATEEELLLDCGGEELRAFRREEGYMLSGVTGLFLPLESREDFSALGLSLPFDREYGEEAEGTRTLRDYGLGLGLSYPTDMSAPENLIADAVVVWDGAMGYVTGRNVTGEYFGEAEDFMEDYMLSRIPGDFRLLYGAEGSFSSMDMLSEGVQGRLASAEGLISGGDGDEIYVKAIMYTSTYADGTVNYICKCFFAPSGDERSFNALANSVLNMTAVRRR